MKLHEHRQARMNLVSRYGPGMIEINGVGHALPLIVAPGLLHTGWIADAAALTPEALEPIWQLQPRIVLLGAAALPTAALRALRSRLAAREAALEAMDLGAACRTYNVLAQEDRPVVALLFP
jgi:uncharacterized protein